MADQVGTPLETSLEPSTGAGTLRRFLRSPSAMVGAGLVLLLVLFGTPLGVISGYYQGAADQVIQRLMDLMLSFTSFLLALTLVALLGEGRNYIFSQTSPTTFPGLAIFLAVMGFNLLGDGLSDALDPQLRGRR